MSDQDQSGVHDDESRELEQALRDALRPIAPPSNFAENVIAGIEAAWCRDERAQIAAARGTTGGTWRWFRWVLAPVGATAVAVGIIIGARLHSEQVKQMRADQVRGQFLVALRITNDQLASAFRLVNDDMAANSSRRTHGRQSD